MTLEGWLGAIAVGAVLGLSIIPPGFVLRKWRGLMAWLNPPDETVVEIRQASFGRYVDGSGRWVPVMEAPALAVFDAEAHSHHCPTCAASRVPDSLRTDYERALIAKEWTAHYKGPARG